MSPARVFDGNRLEWTAHPRFAAIRMKVLEGLPNHPAASVIRVQLAAGGMIEPHLHERATETVLILAGQARLQHGDQQSALGAGMGATVPSGLMHGLENTGETPLELIAVHTPALY
jgi:mannose-6-phosphate isomerase-like protein (cupin superfamily)